MDRRDLPHNWSSGDWRNFYSDNLGHESGIERSSTFQRVGFKEGKRGGERYNYTASLTDFFPHNNPGDTNALLKEFKVVNYGKNPTPTSKKLLDIDRVSGRHNANWAATAEKVGAKWPPIDGLGMAFNTIKPEGETKIERYQSMITQAKLKLVFINKKLNTDAFKHPAQRAKAAELGKKTRGRKQTNFADEPGRKELVKLLEVAAAHWRSMIKSRMILIGILEHGDEEGYDDARLEKRKTLEEEAGQSVVEDSGGPATPATPESDSGYDTTPTAGMGVPRTPIIIPRLRPLDMPDGPQSIEPPQLAVVGGDKPAETHEAEMISYVHQFMAEQKGFLGGNVLKAADNKFATKEEAMEACAKTPGCGGITYSPNAKGNKYSLRKGKKGKIEESGSGEVSYIKK
jgi:hypothetical protein